MGKLKPKPVFSGSFGAPADEAPADADSPEVVESLLAKASAPDRALTGPGESEPEKPASTDVDARSAKEPAVTTKLPARRIDTTPSQRSLAQASSKPTSAMVAETSAPLMGDGTPESREPQSPDPDEPQPSTEEPNWARQAVNSSTLSARQRRATQKWQSAPVRYTIAVKILLTERLVADQERFNDFRLSLNHYISAALGQIPVDAEAAAGWAQAYEDLIGFRSPATQGTKMPLEAEVATAMQRLHARLRVEARYGLLGYVQTWAIIRLLAALEADDAGEDGIDAALKRVLGRLDPMLG